MTSSIRDRSWRRNAQGALAVGSAAVLLAACSSGSGDADAAPQPGDGALAGEVVFWHSFTQGPRAEYMEEMAAKFEDEHPEVDITIETFAWPEFYTKWTTGLAAGQVPDLSTALPNHVVEMINAEALAPVDDVIDDLGRDRFSQAALSEGQSDGVSYSVPIYSHAQVMWYRTDLLAAAGLEVPQTWDELAAAAKALTADGVYGMSVPLGSNDMMATRYLNFYVQSAGETLVDEDGHADLTSDAAIDGINYWVDAYRATSPEGSINYGVLDQATLFYQGKTAFDFNSGFHISGVESTTPDLLGSIAAAPLPRLEAGDEIYGGETSNIPTVVWNASDVQEEAKAFLTFLYNDEDYVDFIHSVPGGMLPALKDVSQSEAYLDDETLTTFADSVAVIEEAVPMGTAIGMEDGPAVQSGIITSQGVIERMFQDIILNGVPVEEAAADAQEQLDELFEAAGAELG
ncbi:ABC transporter substrate-binding protein [Georgenia subflava]|uniref:Extracellular solute-binding protein n=1 Tax=Georgenia subflava TaxID=1622177 RepID=A0A6N7EAW0_9MICO|nr:sugar ABC transporter substrate-binding protein [Georgenia subflava]MPV35522.1 extracellular solute-binding protein [Georgenia subflava]